jgi:hypothetical protein
MSGITPCRSLSQTQELTSNTLVSSNNNDVTLIANGDIHLVPAELMHSIFAMLSGVEVRTKINLVCKRWNKIASDNYLWKKICISELFLGIAISMIQEDVNYFNLFIKDYLMNKEYQKSLEANKQASTLRSQANSTNGVDAEIVRNDLIKLASLEEQKIKPAVENCSKIYNMLSDAEKKLIDNPFRSKKIFDY